MKAEAAILVVVVTFLLPLRLLLFALRLTCGGISAAGDLRRSGVSLALVAALLAAIFAVPGDHGVHPSDSSAPASIAMVAEVEDFRREVRSEIEQLKLQIARLESFWENHSKAVDGKGDALEEHGELVKAMGHDIQSLIDEQEIIKESLSISCSENNIKAMENEVQLLMDESRKMNSDIYQVWSLAKQTEKRVEALYSDIKKGLKHKKRNVPSWMQW